MAATSLPLRIGFLLSGAGRTLQNLAQRLDPALGRLVLVIADRAQAGGLERARELAIPTAVLPCRTPSDSEAIFQALDRAGAQIAILGGFLRRLWLPAAWHRRVINIHPSLLPRFGGQGYYGERVHAAVLAGGDRQSGCTVHFVDEEYDHGPVLLQRTVPVQPDDTVASLAARVFEAECEALPEAITWLARGQVDWHAGRPRVRAPGRGEDSTQ